jgi:hypothetical protein
MSMSRPLCLLATLFALVYGATASAQSVTTFPGLTLGDTINTLTRPLATAPVGEALGLASRLEIATAPLGTTSASFVTKLDPSTGLQVRTATTFGPSFAERALTSGEGKLSVGVSTLTANYDKLGDLSLNGMQLGATNANTPKQSRTGMASFAMSSTTLVISGSVGVTDNFDVSVAVPLVKVTLDAKTWVRNGDGDVLILSTGSGTASGVGDVAAAAKYRFVSFGKGQPDPGGLALSVTMRLPTGDEKNLLGLGVNRTLVALVASGGKGRFRPHANAGFEAWNRAVEVATDAQGLNTVKVRNQFQYAAGVEVEAAPKLTLNVDFLGRNILGGGRVGFRTDPAAPNAFGIVSTESAVVLPQGIRKLTLVPGLRLNLKGNMLLSLNALVALKDNGFHARFIPVIGIDMTL